jgi:hypothetical protein
MRRRVIDSVRVEAGAPRVWYDRMRDVGTKQNQRPEEHIKANESALAVMEYGFTEPDRNLKTGGLQLQHYGTLYSCKT